MSLKAIEYLNNADLVQILEKNGYLEILPIIKEQLIDGKSLLALSEFELIRFKLSKSTSKSLWSCIMEIKKNPAKFLNYSNPSTNLVPLIKSNSFSTRQNAIKNKLEQIRIPPSAPTSNTLPTVTEKKTRKPLPPKPTEDEDDSYVQMEKNEHVNIDDDDDGYLKPSDIQDNVYELEPQPVLRRDQNAGASMISDRKPIAPPRFEDGQGGNQKKYPPVPVKVTKRESMRLKKLPDLPPSPEPQNFLPTRSRKSSFDRSPLMTNRKLPSTPPIDDEENNYEASPTVPKFPNNINKFSNHEAEIEAEYEPAPAVKKFTHPAVRVYNENMSEVDKGTISKYFKGIITSLKPKMTGDKQYENVTIENSEQIRPQPQVIKHIANRPLPAIPAEITTNLAPPTPPNNVRINNNNNSNGGYVRLMKPPDPVEIPKNVTNIASSNIRPESPEQIYENHENLDKEELPEYQNKLPAKPKNLSLQTDLDRRLNKGLNKSGLVQNGNTKPINNLFHADLARRLNKELNKHGLLQNDRNKTLEESLNARRNVPSKNVIVRTAPKPPTQVPEPVTNTNISYEEELPEYGNTISDDGNAIYGNVVEPEKNNHMKKVVPQINSSLTTFDPPLPKPPPMDFMPTVTVEIPTVVTPEEDDDEVYANTLFNINDEPFYRNTDRKGAKELLNGLESGAFLFRPSSNYFLTLTVKHESRFYNIGIEKTLYNKIRCNSVSTAKPPEFDTIGAFINYFKKENLTVENNNQIIYFKLKPLLPHNVF